MEFQIKILSFFTKKVNSIRYSRKVVQTRGYAYVEDHEQEKGSVLLSYYLATTNYTEEVHNASMLCTSAN